MSEAVDYIALAVPVFFLLIGVELLVGKLRKTSYYRFNDALTNISCGIGQQVLNVFVKTVLLLGYVYLYQNHRFLDFPADQWWTWVLLFIGVDFFYYWFHRYAHEISLFWGGHIVHHQSEEYNLSVALRQGAFQTMFSWIFYLPLALIGFDPVTFVVVNQFQTLYQFWIHTKAIDKLHPVFEYVFNTPSHHRVHHGVNPKYIDRNHGGTLIIWDRMFGTFQAEEEEVVYGITKQLKSWNPVWANLDYFRDVGRLLAKCKSPADMFRVLFFKPGWRPEYLGGPQKPGPVSPETFDKYDVKMPGGMSYYVLFQYLFVLTIGSVFLFSADQFTELMPGWEGLFWKVGLALLVVMGISTLGGLMEMKRWAVFGELLRLALQAGVVPLVLYGTGAFWWVVVVSSAVSLVSMLWLSSFLHAFGQIKRPFSSTT